MSFDDCLISDETTAEDECFAIDYNRNETDCWLHFNESVLTNDLRPYSSIDHYRRYPQCAKGTCLKYPQYASEIF